MQIHHDGLTFTGQTISVILDVDQDLERDTRASSRFLERFPAGLFSHLRVTSCIFKGSKASNLIGSGHAKINGLDHDGGFPRVGLLGL